MSSSNYRRRIRTKPPHPEIAKKYLYYWEMGELYHYPGRFPKLTSRILFENENPLEMEIGCGGGEHLVTLATQKTYVNFVGIDTSHKALNQAVVRAARARLDNIRFIRADIKLLYTLLEDNSIRMVYVHFPIPHSGRYRNRRIITERFLDVAHRVLSPGGKISFISDHRRYYDKIVSLVKGDHRFKIRRAYELEVNSGEMPSSHFQRLWLNMGRTVRGFVLKKINQE